MNNVKENFRTQPFGAQRKEVEKAEIASAETSKQLVKDHEKDAFYFRSLERNGICLNAPQIEAVRHHKGPALLLAGAGSGKTRVLTSRTGYLISIHEVQPQNILLLTFTKKAADEMKERIALLPGLTKNMANDITAGTFHSIFLRFLKSQRYAHNLLTNDRQKHTALKIIMKKMNMADAYEPETLLSLLSSFKNHMIVIHDMVPSSPVEKEIKDVLVKYESWKTDNGYMDFDDILIESYFLLKENPNLLNLFHNRFHYILCDEWQDTNPIQYELVKMISSANDNLFVVGDDDQCIYSFNSADSTNILDFEKVYPATRKICLDVNYRSTDSIVGLGNEVIKHNEKRYEKTLQSTKTNPYQPYFIRPDNSDHEAEHIILNIKNEVQLGNRKYKDFAILHRTIATSRAMFEKMVMHNIPFVSFNSGSSFYEQSTVKPVLDHLRVSLDPTNLEAIGGILQSMYLNREKAMEHIQMQELKSPSERPLIHLISLPGVKEFQKKQLFERIQLIQKLKNMYPAHAIKEICKEYIKYLDADPRKKATMHKEMIKETLSEIEAAAIQFPTVLEFVSFVDKIIQKNKEMETTRKDPHADVVSLMTIHKSKGLEFPVVYLIGASETILPHNSAIKADECDDIIMVKPVKGSEKVKAAIEEERRLMYVAVTRAEEELYISSPASYRGSKVDVSRFLLDAYKGQPAPINDQIEEYVSPCIEQKNLKEIALAWDCTNATCIAWVRVNSYEEAELEHRKCPMCQSDMVKCGKEIYA